MVLENAKYHLANLLKEFLESNSHIILEFLPLYSHKLYPIEKVWKVGNSRWTYNGYFLSIVDIMYAVTEQFAMYAKRNSALKKFCAIT